MTSIWVFLEFFDFLEPDFRNPTFAPKAVKTTNPTYKLIWSTAVFTFSIFFRSSNRTLVNILTPIHRLQNCKQALERRSKSKLWWRLFWAQPRVCFCPTTDGSGTQPSKVLFQQPNAWFALKGVSEILTIVRSKLWRSIILFRKTLSCFLNPSLPTNLPTQCLKIAQKVSLKII